MLSAEALAQIRVVVAEEVAKGSAAVAGTMTAGFNVTLPVELRRTARGHDPAVAGNDAAILPGDVLYPTRAPA